MGLRVLSVLLACTVLSLIAAVAAAQPKPKPTSAFNTAVPRHRPLQREALAQPEGRVGPRTEPHGGAVPLTPGVGNPAQPLPPGLLLTSITLGDVGFMVCIRFAILGGRRDVFVPLPQGPVI